MTDPSLFDRLPPYQPHSATSREAAKAVAEPRPTLRRLVYEFIAFRGPDGATDEEIALGLGMNPSTARPRRIELEASGHIVKAGRTRATRSGRQAVVYVKR